MKRKKMEAKKMKKKKMIDIIFFCLVEQKNKRKENVIILNDIFTFTIKVKEGLCWKTKNLIAFLIIFRA